MLSMETTKMRERYTTILYVHDVNPCGPLEDCKKDNFKTNAFA